MKYPIFSFVKSDPMVYIEINKPKIEESSVEILESGYFKGMVVIDSNGKKYIVKNAFKKRLLGLWGFNPFLKGTGIEIGFTYEAYTSSITLEEFKEEIVDRLDKTYNHWQKVNTVEELKTMVMHSPDFATIAYLLA